MNFLDNRPTPMYMRFRWQWSILINGVNRRFFPVHVEICFEHSTEVVYTSAFGTFGNGATRRADSHVWRTGKLCQRPDCHDKDDCGIIKFLCEEIFLVSASYICTIMSRISQRCRTADIANHPVLLSNFRDRLCCGTVKSIDNFHPENAG